MYIYIAIIVHIPYCLHQYGKKQALNYYMI